MSRKPTHLAKMIVLWRAVNNVTLRALSKRTGISHATLMRIEHGYAMDLETWRTLENWLLSEGEPSDVPR